MWEKRAGIWLVITSATVDDSRTVSEGVDVGSKAFFKIWPIFRLMIILVCALQKSIKHMPVMYIEIPRIVEYLLLL